MGQQAAGSRQSLVSYLLQVIHRGGEHRQTAQTGDGVSEVALGIVQLGDASWWV